MSQRGSAQQLVCFASRPTHDREAGYALVFLCGPLARVPVASEQLRESRTRAIHARNRSRQRRSQVSSMHQACPRYAQLLTYRCGAANRRFGCTLGGRPLGWRRRRLPRSRPLRSHRAPRLPKLDIAYAGHAVRRGENLSLQPVRPDQGLAARRPPFSESAIHDKNFR
jgi:hypothetical protein